MLLSLESKDDSRIWVMFFFLNCKISEGLARNKLACLQERADFYRSISLCGCP